MVRLLAALMCAVAPIAVMADPNKEQSPACASKKAEGCKILFCPTNPAPVKVFTIETGCSSSTCQPSTCTTQAVCEQAKECNACVPAPKCCATAAKECSCASGCCEAIKQITKDGCCCTLTTKCPDGGCSVIGTKCCEGECCCATKCSEAGCCEKAKGQSLEVRYNVVRMAPKANLTPALVEALEKTESPDSFLLTLTLLHRLPMAPHEATQVTLAALRNAERLGLTKGLFDEGRLHEQRTQILVKSLMDLAQKSGQPTPSMPTPPVPTYSPAHWQPYPQHPVAAPPMPYYAPQQYVAPPSCAPGADCPPPAASY